MTDLITRGRGGSNYEPGYRSALVREETKALLTDFRTGLRDRDLFQERRLCSAAVELSIEDAMRDPAAKARLLEKAQAIVIRDMNSSQPA